MATPKLSIIVPTYNEAAALPTLLTSLSKQCDLDFELIIVDGGSDDATISLVETFATNAAFTVILVSSMPGRGFQLNSGADIARATNLLFLHADSCFVDSHALAAGLSFLDQAIDNRNDDAVAGHFALCFTHTKNRVSNGYVFFESKARLNRCGCIHGDQGLLVRRSFFQKIGAFDPSLPFLEDEHFAAAVYGRGEWILLPAEIHTSARRFETEGLLPRQMLNALIMNAVAIGWSDFLNQAPDIYRRQGDSGRLDLLPFFRGLNQLFKDMTWRERLHIWYSSGTYVRNNGWQLLFAMDVWLGLRRDPAYRGANTPVLDRFERWFNRCTDHLGGNLLATSLVWAWFHFTLSSLQVREKLAAIFHKKRNDNVTGRN